MFWRWVRYIFHVYPANTTRWTNVGSILTHPLRRRPTIEPKFVQRVVFAGYVFEGMLGNSIIWFPMCIYIWYSNPQSSIFLIASCTVGVNKYVYSSGVSIWYTADEFGCESVHRVRYGSQHFLSHCFSMEVRNYPNTLSKHMASIPTLSTSFAEGTPCGPCKDLDAFSCLADAACIADCK